MKALKAQLCGLLIEGPLEPGHCLLDVAANMLQLSEIRYIPPERCVSRTNEVLDQKSPSKQIDIAAESLVVKEKTEVPDMVATSALQVQEALQRRGIAQVFAELAQHNLYFRYLTSLFEHLHREPPPGYNRCSVSQLVAADKLVWQILLEEGVQPKRSQAGTLALDTKLLETLESFRVSFSLLPLLAKKEGTGNIQKKIKPLHSGFGGKGAPAGRNKPWLKSKGGKKGAKSKQRVPVHIFNLGGTAANPEGEPICFGINSEGGCADAAEGFNFDVSLHEPATDETIQDAHSFSSSDSSSREPSEHETNQFCHPESQSLLDGSNISFSDLQIERPVVIEIFCGSARVTARLREGLMGLTGKNFQRVSAANKLYDFVAHIIKEAVELKLVVAVENPRSSLFWMTRFWKSVSGFFGYTAHQACAYAYPKGLARAIARVFAEEYFQHTEEASLQVMRTVSNIQPQVAKMPPVAREHKQIVVVRGSLVDLSRAPVGPMQRLKSVYTLPETCNFYFSVLPEGAQLLRATPSLCWAGSGGAPGSQLTPWTPRLFAWQAWHLVAGVALEALCVTGRAIGDIHLHFAWQAWHFTAWH
ncbi:unnamed protein product [Cladocopium goreaui]|uniref:C3H1-type domain-containing protein n=1 Tax=Cladocopium goreaui TaxID=2562237 RepID=A0A9P1GEU4_9DINO|nr:unnamed protein product [Cladocopium goreaui]